jgi:hypothetical protein
MQKKQKMTICMTMETGVSYYDDPYRKIRVEQNVIQDLKVCDDGFNLQDLRFFPTYFVAFFI